MIRSVGLVTHHRENAMHIPNRSGILRTSLLVLAVFAALSNGTDAASALEERYHRKFERAEILEALNASYAGGGSGFYTAQLFTDKGWILYQRKDFAGALEAFETALDKFPKIDDAVLGKVFSLYHLDQKQEARDFLRGKKIYAHGYQSEEIQIEILIELKQYERALELCDQIEKSYTPVGADLVRDHHSPGFFHHIQRYKIYRAMGLDEAAADEARHLYRFRYRNSFAEKNALRMFAELSLSVPADSPYKNSDSVNRVHQIIDQMIAAEELNEVTLASIFGRTLEPVVLSNRKYYCFYDGESPISHVVFKPSSIEKNEEFISATLNMLTLVDRKQFEEWYPDAIYHPARVSGCTGRPAYIELSVNGRRFVYEFSGGGHLKPSNQLLNMFSVFTDPLSRLLEDGSTLRSRVEAIKSGLEPSPAKINPGLYVVNKDLLTYLHIQRLISTADQVLLCRNARELALEGDSSGKFFVAPEIKSQIAPREKRDLLVVSILRDTTKDLEYFPLPLSSDKNRKLFAQRVNVELQPLIKDLGFKRTIVLTRGGEGTFDGFMILSDSTTPNSN